MVKYLLTFLFFFYFINCKGQAPNGLSFQAVVRNSEGEVISNQQIQVKLSILRGSNSGPILYSELHSPTTNFLGLFSLTIGQGIPITGLFQDIDWSGGDLYLKREIDPNNNGLYPITGTTQFLTIPYSFYSNVADSSRIARFSMVADSVIKKQQLSISNDTIYLSGGGSIKLPASNGFDGDYNNLTNKPTIPSNTSQLTNDAGFLTSEVDGSITNEIQVLSISNDTIYLSGGGFAKLPAGFDGDYASLTNKPTIPSNTSQLINDAGFLKKDSFNIKIWELERMIKILESYHIYDPKIGDYFQGGIIFHIYQNGDNNYVEGEINGLIVAIENAGKTYWKSSFEYANEVKDIGLTTYTDYLENEDIGVGASNSKSVLLLMDSLDFPANTFPAIEMADNFYSLGFDDWYLPSIGELVLLKNSNINFIEIGIVSTSSESNFWSSSLMDNKIGAMMLQSNNSFCGCAYFETYSVRPIRNFKHIKSF